MKIVSPASTSNWTICPNAEALISHRLLVLPWNENYTEADVDDIAAGIRKVHSALEPK